MPAPTPEEVQDFAASFTATPSAASKGALSLPQTQTTNGPSQQDVADFAATMSGGRNAPPNTLTATPRMGEQTLYGRTDAQGRPVPLDSTSGYMAAVPLGDNDTGFMPVMSYWKIANQSDPQAKADYLQKLYPDKKVRILDTGDVTLEVPDLTTGRTKDVVLNPAGMDAHDLLDLAASAPELAAEAATFFATKGKGVMRKVGQMIASSFAGGFTGKVRDVATRAATDIPVRPEDISRERDTQTGVDLGMQGLAGVAGKVIPKVISPFATATPEGSLAFNLKEGREFLKNTMGIDYETTPGMRTGSPALLAIEAAESPMPGARVVTGKIQVANNAAIQDSQRLALGRVSTEEQIGMDAFNSLRDKVVGPALEDAFQQARQIALESGDKRVLGLLNEAMGQASSRISTEEAGNITRDAYQRRLIRAQGMVDADYAAVRSLPGGSGDVLPGDAAASAAADIRKELPAKLIEADKPTGIFDASGKPITKTVEERQLLKSGLPDDGQRLLKALDDLEGLKGSKVSLDTLTNMKKAAHDAIAAFKSAHGDAKDRWFSKIAGAYEQGIQQGIDSTENLALKDALATARDTYKREMVPLEQVGLREMAKTTEDAGFLSGTQIATKVFEGPQAVHNFNLLQQALGPNNVAFKALKRAWTDTKLTTAWDAGLQTYDAEALARAFKGVNEQSPELAEALFGKNHDKIMQALQVKGGIQKAGITAIDQGELRTLLNLKDPTVDDLRNVLTMGKLRDTGEVNAILKDINDGVLKDNFNPATFVEKLRNTDVPTTDVRQALGKLPSTIRDQIATAELYRILSEGSRAEGETAAKAFTGQPVNLSATKLVNALGKDSAARERTRLLLAEDLPVPASGEAPPVVGKQTTANRADYLLALVKTLAPKEAANTVFSGLGSIGSASAVRQLTTGPLKYATGYTKNILLASAYTKGLGRILTNKVFDDEASAAFANILIASEPTIRLMTETFGPDTAKAVVADAKRSIDQFIRQLHDTPEGRRRTAAQTFLRGQQPTAGGQPVPMQLQAR